MIDRLRIEHSMHRKRASAWLTIDCGALPIPRPYIRFEGQLLCFGVTAQPWYSDPLFSVDVDVKLSESQANALARALPDTWWR